jgi:DNA invertase Pin-like site-specific DNA recombinase
MPIRERPGIGPYLAEDRLGDWDGIIGWRLDRLFRSQLDFLLWVRDIGDKHGKVIIDTEDGTDTSTPAGRRTLNDRAQAADYERQRMAERRSRAARRIRQESRYGGGLVPFGLKKQRSEVGWTLVECKPYADEVRSIVERILKGESANAIVMDMNKRRVPTSRDAQRILEGKEPTGAVWATNSLLRYLRSPTLKGYVLNYPKKGETGQPKIVYGRDGLPIRRVAILDDQTWADLQQAIRVPGEGRKTGRRTNVATKLLGIAVCEECGGSLHSEKKGGRRSNAAGKEIEPIKRRYYGCANRHYRGCTARLIPMDELDASIEPWMTTGSSEGGAFGDNEIVMVGRARTSKREARMTEITDAMRDLALDDPSYDEKHAALRAEWNRLRTQEPEEEEPVEKPTGMLLKDYWPTLSDEEKRLHLLTTGFKFRAWRDEDGKVHAYPSGGDPARIIGALTRVMADD